MNLLYLMVESMDFYTVQWIIARASLTIGLLEALYYCVLSWFVPIVTMVIILRIYYFIVILPRGVCMCVCVSLLCVCVSKDLQNVSHIEINPKPNPLNLICKPIWIVIFNWMQYHIRISIFPSTKWQKLTLYSSIRIRMRICWN